ncbi:MAG: asparaginase, partial [Rikenellaceae bacterium]
MAVLIIYTGGTIGMKTNPITGALAPFNFDEIEKEMPELKKFGVKIDTFTFNPTIDSSNVNQSHWSALANIIKDNYDQYDGFVVLHGTDTMSYTASALSFMLQNLTKAVVFTGSQIPIGVLRTDG